MTRRDVTRLRIGPEGGREGAFSRPADGDESRGAVARLGVKTRTRASSVSCITRAGATAFVTHAGATVKLGMKVLKSHLTMAQLHLQNMRRLLGAVSAYPVPSRRRVSISGAFSAPCQHTRRLLVAESRPLAEL